MRLIDADALKSLPFHRLTHTDFGETCVSFEEIDNAPTIMPEKAKEGELVKAYTKGFDNGVEIARQKGEWLPTPDDVAEFKCSICDKPNFWEENFCPNCGASMKGGAE